MKSQPQNPEFKSNPVYRQILFIKLGRMNVLSQITIEIKKNIDLLLQDIFSSILLVQLVSEFQCYIY